MPPLKQKNFQAYENNIDDSEHGVAHDAQPALQAEIASVSQHSFSHPLTRGNADVPQAPSGRQAEKLAKRKSMKGVVGQAP